MVYCNGFGPRLPLLELLLQFNNTREISFHSVSLATRLHWPRQLQMPQQQTRLEFDVTAKRLGIHAGVGVSKMNFDVLCTATRIVVPTGPGNLPVVRVQTAETGLLGYRPVQAPDMLFLGRVATWTRHKTIHFELGWSRTSVQLWGSYNINSN